MQLDPIHRIVLTDCVDDDTSLGGIIWQLLGTGYDPDDPDLRPLRPKVLDVVRTLLAAGLIYAENPKGTTFERIGGSVADVMDHINREWDLLGRTPAFGEVCWFRATPAGKKLAKDLGLWNPSGH